MDDNFNKPIEPQSPEVKTRPQESSLHAEDKAASNEDKINAIIREQQSQNSGLDKNALFETFHKDNLKILLRTSSAQRIIRGGIAVILAILFFFAAMSIMLSGNKTNPSANQNNSSTQTQQTQTNRDQNFSSVQTKVGNPTTIPPKTSQPQGSGPIQKTQIYTINQDYKDVTFKAIYADPDLLVDFVVTDPKKNTYTIGDESKYGGGRLFTEWGKTSRIIKLSNMVIEKGSWTVDLYASKNVPIEITLNGTPK